MATDLYNQYITEFFQKTGLVASENPTAYVEFVKMKAQELIYNTLVDIKAELAAIKQKIN